MRIPCDEPLEEVNEETGKTEIHYRCPFDDAYTGYESEMCRCMCGVGVDE